MFQDTHSFFLVLHDTHRPIYPRESSHDISPYDGRDKLRK